MSKQQPTVAPANRVRVAVRCRPPFEEEGQGATAVRIVRPPPTGSVISLPRTLQIDISSEKCREFSFDAVFGAEASNNEVYDVVAGPIVDGVMKGVNGTVMAYGQTGSGKTHSLGILTRVAGESGIIPRSLSHIFGYISAAQASLNSSPNSSSENIRPHETSSSSISVPTFSVTMSFLQIYLDTVQDLLAPNGVAPQMPGLVHVQSGTSSSNGVPSTPAGNSSTQQDASFSLNVSSSGPSRVFGSAVRARSGGNAGPVSSNEEVPGAFSAINNAPNSGHLSAQINGLHVREDPARGFYVEGLSEFHVSSFAQALMLLNCGLENRILGQTRMNATSSRSHTALIVRVEVREPLPANGTSNGGFVTRRSQLMLCDLAGSERVRRTSSRGARLEEARAINVSLHTLGQVITALSVVSQQHQHHLAGGGGGGAPPKVHVPWRDSKLTRLLYGNLGGSSNTFLLATIGPSVINTNETLSTLLFASRCMRVSSTPVASLTHTQLDYADLAARLQARLSGLDAQHAVEVSSLQSRFEGQIQALRARLDEAASAKAEALTAAATAQAALKNSASYANSLIASPGGIDNVNVSLFSDGGHGIFGDKASSSCTESMYVMLCSLHDAVNEMLVNNYKRTAKHRSAWARAIGKAQSEESELESARASGKIPTPVDQLEMVKQLANSADDQIDVPLPAPFVSPFGAKYASPATVMQSVHSQHNFGNNDETSSLATLKHPLFDSFESPSMLQSYCSALSTSCSDNVKRIDELFAAKDQRFDEVKRHLAAAETALRVRDEDVQSQRYVLKYLVDATSSLRKQLSESRNAGGRGESSNKTTVDGSYTNAYASNVFDDESSFGERSGASASALLLDLSAEGIGVNVLTSSSVDGASLGGATNGAGAYINSSSNKISSLPPRPPLSNPPGRPPRPPPAVTVVSSLSSSSSGLSEDDDPLGGDRIERIVSHRLVEENGVLTLLLKVHWEGSTPADDEWFPRADLIIDFPEVVEEYERSMKKNFQ